VIGDFCRWNDHVVSGCDDTAKREFLNKRKAKGEIAVPQSQSNLWFARPEAIDRLGPVIGRGAVWMKEDLTAGTVSDPCLFAGYAKRGLHLTHDSAEPVAFALETGDGLGTWSELQAVEVETKGSRFIDLPATEPGEWIRLRVNGPVAGATAVFTYRAGDPRAESADPMFDGLAKPGQARTGGVVLARDGGSKTLSFAALDANGKAAGHYQLDGDLFHADGSFYELPASNAGGIAKVRPVATHKRLVHDFCSYRGLFVMSGVATDASSDNPHIIRSDDGKVALWAGAIDDVWKLGKPGGTGGPWKSTKVKAGGDPLRGGASLRFPQASIQDWKRANPSWMSSTLIPE
jgi:hypothetical protein